MTRYREVNLTFGYTYVFLTYRRNRCKIDQLDIKHLLTPAKDMEMLVWISGTFFHHRKYRSEVSQRSDLWDAAASMIFPCYSNELHTSSPIVYIQPIIDSPSCADSAIQLPFTKLNLLLAHPHSRIEKKTYADVIFLNSCCRLCYAIQFHER